MIGYLNDFLKRYEYPSDAIDVAMSAYAKLKDNADFNDICEKFYTGITNDEMMQVLGDISKNADVDLYTVYLVFFLVLTPVLENKYKDAGIADNIYCDTVVDIKYKLMECKNVHNIWGLEPFGWYAFIFRMGIFALGRLEYNMDIYRFPDTEVAGRKVNQGDAVIKIHIPSSGKPFDKQSRIDSYEKAYHFFKGRFDGKEPVFMCESWLLNPVNKEILGEKSNVSSFIDDFDMKEQYDYKDNSNMWRIFGADADLPPAQLPRGTSMQRAFADWLMKGNKLGAGVGLFMFDPVNKKILK